MRAASARRQGLTEEKIQHAKDLARYGAEFSEEEQAAIRYALQLVDEGANEEMLEPYYRELGRHYSDEQVLELAVFCALCIGFDKVIRTLEVPVEACPIVPGEART